MNGPFKTIFGIIPCVLCLILSACGTLGPGTITPPIYFSAPTGITAVPAVIFLSTMGVNVHLAQGQDEKSVANSLVYLGLHSFRDNYTVTNDCVQMYKQYGLREDCLSGDDNESLEQQLNACRTLANAGALLSIEGPNEPGNWYVTWNNNTSGQSTWIPVAQFQSALYNTVKHDPVLQYYPVFNASSIGDEADNVGLQFLVVPQSAVSNDSNPTGVYPAFIGLTNADYVNQHSYINQLGHAVYSNVNEAWNNFATNSIIPFDDTFFADEGVTWNKGFKGYNDVTPIGGFASNEYTFANLPRVNTELGWPSIPNNEEFPNNITQDQQGKLYMNVYFAAFKWGCTYTAIYEIIDDSENNWGFFDKNYNPKLAAIYLHNLTTILADSNYITPGKLNYSITTSSGSGEPFTVHDLLLQRSNGNFELCVWDENPPGEDNIIVNLGTNYNNVAEYDPTESFSSIPVGNTNSVSLEMSDHLVIIEVPYQ